ncbi:MAG: tRNA dihydrouridine synthase DusB, partial [Rhodothermales bacterium]|nr:tRNA dihydrouridine synthase DusB [Rhodothermales bacterium]
MFLAPMEDVSDPPFRVLCKRYGADLLYTEFISSGGLVHDAEGSRKKLDFSEEERPLAIQIFGGELEQVREAAGIVDGVRPDIIDINFGCPVKKVVCKDGGAGILRNLPKMKAITEAVVEATSLPVTVKTRLGWDDGSIRIVEVARMLEDVGVQALAVHARTRSQMYRGDARWEWFRRIREEAGLSIPLIGNGDATTPDLVKTMFDETGVDAVMVGRGAIGNPWIFRDARVFMETGELPEPPSWEERLSVVAEHLKLK